MNNKRTPNQKERAMRETKNLNDSKTGCRLYTALPRVLTPQQAKDELLKRGFDIRIPYVFSRYKDKVIIKQMIVNPVTYKKEVT